MDIVLRNTVKKQLLWVALVSISMFFASMLSAFIVEKADVVNWKVFILPDQFEISTAIIILSSFLLFFIKPLLKREKSIFGLVFIVLILGILFSYFQIKGWQQLTTEGVYLTGAGSNVAGSF